jgi:hypothetical protein
MIAMRTFLVLLAAATLTACHRNPDSAFWECELAVQKENAGKSAEAMAEKSRAIESCMEDRGYRVDFGKPACRSNPQTANCYQSR